MSERDKLRAAQAREVMPIIGPLLDAWQGLPNDVQDMDELTEVAGYMDALEQAMDADPDDGGEPISTLECGMGCGRKFASPEGRDHHEELCTGKSSPKKGTNHE